MDAALIITDSMPIVTEGFTNLVLTPLSADDVIYLIEQTDEVLDGTMNKTSISTKGMDCVKVPVCTESFCTWLYIEPNGSFWYVTLP